TVTIAIVTDGLVDVVSVGGVAVTPAGYQVIGGDIPARAFLGALTISGSTLTRANGSDLGSFVDEGFKAGQRITISSCGGTVFTIASVAANGKTMVLTSAPACGGT